MDRIIPTEDGKAVISYGVIDDSKNVGTATRIVTYIADAQKESNQDADAWEQEDTGEGTEGAENKAKETDQAAEKMEQANVVPDIVLSTGQAVIPAGSEFDPLSVVAGGLDEKRDPNALLQQVTVEGDYDIYTPGDYQLNYYVTDSDKNTSEVRSFILTVQ
ncbi:MAG TPA: hypothetical protein DIW17_18945 [Clostridiales bacterium]|nr:hypothetical protein [Clostridiales bacterium]